MPRIGAHVSTAGGLNNAITNAKNIGANCMQIFSSAPQQWLGSIRTPEEKLTFKKSVEEADLLPVFIHGTYLMNFASDNPEIVEKSVSCLSADLIFASEIGAMGVIFHFGSHASGWSGKRKELSQVFKKIIDTTPSETLIVIENAAGSGVKIGSKLEELAMMRDDINSPRIKFCIDSAHAFAAGYDLSNIIGVNNYITQVQKILDWNNVAAIHLNDSKVPLNKGTDRHENIGQGFIGANGLREFVRHPQLINKPLILEVPGFESKGPDANNIKLVKEMFKEVNGYRQ